MVRFNLWTWSNSLRVWKAALKKEELSYSEKAINKGISSAKKNKNKKKLLTIEFFNSRYLKN